MKAASNTQIHVQTIYWRVLLGIIPVRAGGSRIGQRGKLSYDGAATETSDNSRNCVSGVFLSSCPSLRQKARPLLPAPASSASSPTFWSWLPPGSDFRQGEFFQPRTTQREGLSWELSVNSTPGYSQSWRWREQGTTVSTTKIHLENSADGTSWLIGFGVWGKGRIQEWLQEFWFEQLDEWRCHLPR